MGITGFAETKKTEFASKENTKIRSKRITPRPGNEYTFIIPSDDFLVTVPAHFIWNSKGAKTYVKCLGDECPICIRNREIEEKHPDSFREVGDYSPVIPQFAILVLDVTKYVYCQNCGMENNITNTTCWKCKTEIKAEPEPANSWKALVLSKSRISNLAATIKLFQEEYGEDYGSFYTKLLVKREGGKSQLTFSNFLITKNKEWMKKLLQEKLEDFEFNPEVLEKYAVTELTADEILSFLSGASLSSIFKTRREAASSDNPKEGVENGKEESNNDVKEKVNKKLNELFGEQ